MIAREAQNARGSPAVLTISHVCHSWRLVALGNPALWTHLPVPGNAALNALFVQRSRPLNIHCTWLARSPRQARMRIGHPSQSTTDTIFEEATRFGSLVVNVTDSHHHPPSVLTSISGVHMAQLQKLDISLKRRLPHAPSLNMSWYTPEQTPALRSLFLEGCEIPDAPTRLILYNLTALRLKDIMSWGNIVDLTDLLAHMPLLETLHFSRLVQGNVNALLPVPTERTALPRLKELSLGSIYSHQSDCVDILVRIDIPKRCTIDLIASGQDIRTLGGDVLREMGDNFSGWLFQQMGGLSGSTTPFDACKIFYPSQHGFSMHYRVVFECMDPSKDLPARISMQSSFIFSSVHSLLRRALSVPAMAYTDTVDLSPAVARAVGGVYDSFQQINTGRFSGTRNMTQAFHEDCPTVAGWPWYEALLQRLHGIVHVELHSIHLNEEDTDGFWHSLADWLTNEDHRTLAIVNCTVTHELVSVLRESLIDPGRLRWDEVEEMQTEPALGLLG